MKCGIQITHAHTYTFNDFIYNKNKLETQIKLVMGRTYKYHTPSDASIHKLMPTRALN